MPYALCPMPYALCPPPYALCPMPYALCPISSVHRTVTEKGYITPFYRALMPLATTPNTLRSAIFS